MGGLFRAPKPVVVPPPTPAPETTASNTPPPEQVGEAARVVARARSQRGLPGTIATSPRGVLDALPGLPRKTLLGE